VKIGILGAGQLGQMLALAGYPLGYEFLFLDPTEGSPASRLAPQIVADYTDPEALLRLCEADLVTYEFENVPEAAAAAIAARKPLHPNPTALKTSQDRLLEKTQFLQLGISTPKFANVTNLDELRAALQTISFPSILKTRRFGYDGKGQRRLSRVEEGERAFEELGQVPCVLEQQIPFTRELSLICVRSVTGELAYYPLVQNIHESGILRVTLAPAPDLTLELQQLAQSYAERLLTKLDYTGVLTLELFQINGQLLANEFAPRVHNSGHFTIEGAVTSQFENHLRAITGLPLGDTSVRDSVAMLNFVGNMPKAADILRFGDVHVHDYGKQPRAGRKLGHVTVLSRTDEERTRKVATLMPILVGCGAMPAMS